jgi:hypothetical protein
MQVTFTRAGQRRYSVAIVREHGPRLQPRLAPGYDDLMPHDLAHFVVEEQFGIALGVFGQLAAGGAGIFAPAPADRAGRTRRSAHRISLAGRDDMRRSEALAWLCVSEWQRRAGRRASLPSDADASAVPPADLDRAVRRLDEVSSRWQALAVGESLTLTWPERLTFNAAGSRRGRKSSNDRPGARR